MEINAKLDFDLIALEQQDTVHVLLEMTAPELPGARRRDPATLEVVIDRSGSMADGRLHAALQAIHSLVGRLAPEDRLGLVVFDDSVQVPIPAGALGDGAQARAALQTIFPGGMTNLGAGLVRGIQETQRIASEGTSASLVVLSDGHTNQGVTDQGQLAAFAAGAADNGVSTSTIGIGLGYDEALLEAVARGGRGNNHFAEHGDDAGAALASEVDGLLEQSAQAVNLTVRPGDAVSGVRLFNDLPTAVVDGGFMAELGDMTAGETRRIMLEIDVPAMAALGPATACELELRWVDVDAMSSKVATLPVNVNVVPGDEAAGRVPNPEVRTELAFQEAQRAKREAADALSRGDLHVAEDHLRRATSDLSAAAAQAPAALASGLAEEGDVLERMLQDARIDHMRAAKSSRADYHLKSRKRGRG